MTAAPGVAPVTPGAARISATTPPTFGGGGPGRGLPGGRAVAAYMTWADSGAPPGRGFPPSRGAWPASRHPSCTPARASIQRAVSSGPQPMHSGVVRVAVTKRTRYEVMRRDNFTCRYCRSSDGELTVDHVTPVALGGDDRPENLVSCCKDCNSGKASSAPDAALVADVSDDAIRWSGAMESAAQVLPTPLGA